MAKFNINFNNTDYSIDESSLSEATASLQQHLSTVMNGSGAVIDFGGASYNVDSTKLTTATNTFISHLGTIAGNGSKLVVNGVQYSVDPNKLSGAIAELHEVLGGLHSENEGSEQNMEVILAEQTVSGFSEGETGIPEVIPLVAGETYTVVWDGVSYECVAERCVNLGVEFIVLGSSSVLNENCNGAGFPFVIAACDEYTGTLMCSTTCENVPELDLTSDTHTVAIYKMSEDGGNGGSNETVILAEQTLTFVEHVAYLENELPLTLGEKYLVVWDGTEYTCVCDELGGTIFIGNRQFADSREENTGEPFVIGIVDGCSTAMCADSAPTHTVAIYKVSCPIRFGEEYVCINEVDGHTVKMIFIFYEDGSLSGKTYMDGELVDDAEIYPAGALTYRQNEILDNFDNGKVAFTVNEDGTQLTIPDIGSVYTLEA